MKEIERELVKSYPAFGKNIYWSPDNTLYKICSLIPNYQKRIEFLKYIFGIENIPGLLLPTSLLYDIEIFGYEIPYISGSINIDSYLQNPAKDIDINGVITTLFQALDEIHKHFIFGDVRNSNILIKDNKATFIDWDFGIKLGSNDKVFSYYFINLPTFTPTILDDLTKTFICALCLLYHIDFEKFIMYNSLFSLKNILKNSGASKELINCINLIIQAYRKKTNNLTYDFKEIFANITPPSKKEITRIREKIKN